MNTYLYRLVSNEEVLSIVSELGALKVPGPDGFPGLFFKKNWNVVGDEVCALVRAFFNEELLLKDFDTTNLLLIPKVASPETVSHFHPISLCNFIYKIILKTMANRLKLFMDKLISPHQSAFVPGRAIQDNIIIAHEVFH